MTISTTLDYEPPKAPTLKQRAIRGTIWTMGGYGASQVLRLGGNMVLARLLFPKAFGVMAIVNVFLIGLQMFSDIGIGPSIIRHKRGEDRDFVNTAWTVQVMRGVTLWVVACLLAWPVSRFYGEPGLAYYIPVAALSALIAGFASTSIHTLNRKLLLGKLTLVELGAQASMLVVMVIWAVMSRSLWALVIGNVVSAIVQMVASHFLEPYRVWFKWDKEAVKELTTFGRTVFVSTGVLFLANQSERMIMGHYTTMDILGVYSIAYFLARVGTVATEGLARKVLFPSLSQLLREDERRAERQYFRLTNMVAIGALVMLACAVSGGPWLIRHLYDHRYWAAGAILQVLAIQGVLETTRCLANWLLLAAGKPGYGVWAWLSRAVTLFIGLPLAFKYGTFSTAVWVIALSTMPPALVFAYGVGKTFPRLRKREWLASMGTCCASLMIYWLLK